MGPISYTGPEIHYQRFVLYLRKVVVYNSRKEVLEAGSTQWEERERALVCKVSENMDIKGVEILCHHNHLGSHPHNLTAYRDVEK